jgi:hypothetical protein
MYGPLSTLAKAGIFVAVATVPFVPLEMQTRAEALLASCGDQLYLPPIGLACNMRIAEARDARLRRADEHARRRTPAGADVMDAGGAGLFNY